ncbi:alcohol dehydrogenase catalytic domain-containing protein [Nakamurella leprariae]|uniref:Alcohol dehydrogenase catalytic domain-containing protein n=1 Tax=Nakamurella leprariae TaxID=2803911 RepID=A0A939BV13_9ACTN|nr:alcohol dehydrogenase catalytic domain-containing protein [Nakamurella leprariae]MBM9466073.1 alcohol dehydrogenase catalytic domain-containing protein [Nakamurella leprariae]
MRAILIEEYGELPRVAEVPEPECPPDGAVVEVTATGVCRSDWHAWLGHDRDVRLPHVPGHEFAGVLVQLGEQVTGWVVGDRVTAPFVYACGSCPACRTGQQQVCRRQTQPGFTHWGSFADRVVVHHADVNLVPVPDGIADTAAAALGCRFATAHRAVRHHGAVRAGDTVAVYGCGGLGLSAVMIAVAAGATVIAVDPAPVAREAAVRFGAIAAVDPGRLGRAHEIAEQVRSLAGGDGVAVAVDAIGRPDVLAASVLSLGRRGRHVQAGLLLGEHAAPAVPMDRVIAWELQLFGSHGMAAGDYPAMLAEIADGSLDPTLLVGTVAPLTEAPTALAALGGRPDVAGLTVLVP